MAARRRPSQPRTFRIRLTVEDEQRQWAHARATGEDVHALLREDLRALGAQLRLHTDDGLQVTLVGDELRITLTPVGERRLYMARPGLRPMRDDRALTTTSPRSALGRIDATRPPVTVVSAELAENADRVACVTDETPSSFADDVHTMCAECGVPIHHRPHAPTRPKKVCLECASRATLN
jgi:hypothetical protein